MNNQINRSVQPDQLGFITFKLDLLSSTILALSRDALRLPALRQPQCNYTRLSLSLGILVASITNSVIIYFTSSENVLLAPIMSDFYWALLITSSAALLEVVADSAVIDLILQKKIKEKLLIESSALIIKIAFILHRVSMKNNANDSLKALLWTFSYAHLLYSATLIVLHSFVRGRIIKINLLPSKPDKSEISLTKELTTQAYLKFFLAQGDRFIVASLSSLQDQGVYTVVSNYGSLILRTLIQPIEEASLQCFSQIKHSNPKCQNYLITMLKAFGYIGLFFICYASFFTDVVVYHVLGARWLRETTAATALSAYCYLVAFAGISGFMEAFVSAQITIEWIAWQRNISIGLSVFYCLLAIAMINWYGSVGLIAANTVNFVLRCLFSAYFINSKVKSLTSFLRLPKIVISSLISAYIVNYSLSHFINDKWIIRIGIAAFHFLITILLIYKLDTIFIYNLKTFDTIKVKE